MLERLGRSGLALAVAIVLLLAIGTGVVAFVPPLLDATMRQPSESPREVTGIAALGEQVYLREGCQNCHTQLVRPVAADVESNLGPATEPGDAAYQAPHLFGAVRIGPDLSCAADRFPAEGTDDLIRNYLAHPGNALSGSKMPSYGHLSEADLDALTAYLLTRTCGLERPEATPAPGESPPAGEDPLAACEGEADAGTGPELRISAENVAFDTDRLEGPTHCQPFTIVFENREAVPHNVSIYTDSGLSQVIFKEETFSGPEEVTYEIPALPAGEYYFQCDVHPLMNGTLVVGE